MPPCAPDTIFNAAAIVGKADAESCVHVRERIKG
jgi:hypothetical protein